MKRGKTCRVVAVLAMWAWMAADARGADLADLLRRLGSSEYAQREAASAELRKVSLEDEEMLLALAARETDAEVAARLWARVNEMDMEWADRNANAPWESSWPVLRGQVVDENGKGVAGARITTFGEFNPNVLSCIKQEGRADAAGKFAVRIPFSDVVHYVHAEGPGPQLGRMARTGTAREVLPEAGLGGPMVLRCESVPQLLRARLVDPQGRPVAGREVRLLAPYEDIPARSGADGSISWQVERFTDEPFVTWGTGAMGEQGAVVPIRQQLRNVVTDLVMEAPGTMKGRITAKGTDQGVAGVRVVLSWSFMDRMAREVVTGADGTYRVTGLPAGAYQVDVASEKYAEQYPKHGAVGVKAGGETEVNREVLTLGVIAGRVVDAEGRPAAAAFVATEGPEQDRFSPGRYRLTVCDEQGRFWIAALPVAPEGKCRVEAYTSKGGAAIEAVAGVIPGQVRRGVELKLGGAVRVTGVVVDEEGKPVRGVNCGPQPIVTGEDGRFDLGQMAVSKERPLNVKFRAPRAWWAPQRKALAPAEVLVLYEERMLLGEEGSVNWEVVLRRTPLMEIGGRVLNGRGLSVWGAKVALMSGEVDQDVWQRVSKELREGPAEGYGTVMVGEKSVSYRWVTSGSGGWTLWHARESSVTDDGKHSAGPLSVGAMLDGKLSALRPLSKQEMAGERCELDVRLE